jgi:general secretion pathway protein K
VSRGPGCAESRKGEQGFALVITLIVTALLVALAAEFVDEVFVETTLSHNFVAEQQASVLAASGVDGGISLIKFTLSSQNYTTLSDPWAKPIQVPDEAGTLTVTIEEESGKLNLNKVVPPGGRFDEPKNFYFLSTVNLLKKLKLPPDLGDAVVDWLDGGDEQQPGGAESSYYTTLKPPYRAKNYALETVEELGLVKGFGGGVARQLQPFVTVYLGVVNEARTFVNINTAPKEVLASLQYGDVAMTDALADAVIDYRKVTPFKTTNDLSKVPGMATIVQSELAGYLNAIGKVFRIRSEARVKETRRTVEAVVRFEGNQPKVLYWREY